jgi:hypothetical protein
VEISPDTKPTAESFPNTTKLVKPNKGVVVRPRVIIDDVTPKKADDIQSSVSPESTDENEESISISVDEFSPSSENSNGQNVSTRQTIAPVIESLPVTSFIGITLVFVSGAYVIYEKWKHPENFKEKLEKILEFFKPK